MNGREQEKMLQSSLEQMTAFLPSDLPQHPEKLRTNQVLKCPRCDSRNTKFCYYNNYSLTQPRHFCKNCKRYWTIGGILRNVPVGGGCRKDKRSKQRNAQQGAVKFSNTSLSSPTISAENSSGTRGSIYSNGARSPGTPHPANGRGTCATSGCLQIPVDEPRAVNLPPSNAVNATIAHESKAICSSSAESSSLSLLLSSSTSNSMLDEFLDNALLSSFTMIPNMTSFGNLDSDHFNGRCSTLERIPDHHHLTATAGPKSETESSITWSCMQGADSLNCVNNFSCLQCMPQQQQQQEYQELVRGSMGQDSRQQQIASSWRMLMQDSLCGYRSLSEEGFGNGSLDWQLLPEGLFDPPASLCYMNGTL